MQLLWIVRFQTASILPTRKVIGSSLGETGGLKRGCVCVWGGGGGGGGGEGWSKTKNLP